MLLIRHNAGGKPCVRNSPRLFLSAWCWVFSSVTDACSRVVGGYYFPGAGAPNSTGGTNGKPNQLLFYFCPGRHLHILERAHHDYSSDGYPSAPCALSARVGHCAGRN